jgi:hypothetical protein
VLDRDNLSSNTSSSFELTCRKVHFPIRHVNIEVPNLEFLRGFIAVRWVYEQVKGASTSLRVQILFMAIVAGRAVTGSRGSGSVRGLRVGQVWIRSAPSKVRSGFVPAQQARRSMRSSYAAVCGTDGRSLGCVEEGFFRCNLIAPAMPAMLVLGSSNRSGSTNKSSISTRWFGTNFLTH